MKRFARNTILTVGLFVGLTSAHNLVRAGDPDNDPHGIMKRAAQRAGGDRTLMRVKMTIKDSSGTRERMLNMRSRREEGARKSLIQIESPNEVRNTGFLSLDYSDKAKSDEQWLYLPKLHRVSRIPSSGKSDPFLGSDFSYSDLLQQDPDDFQYKLVEQSVKVGDEDCWLIEAVPRDEQVQSALGYSKTHTWMSKSKLIPVQLKGWSNKTDKIKYFKAMDVAEIDGVWTPKRLQMRTMQGNSATSETLLELLSVKNNSPEVSDADFNHQRLERGL